MFTTVFMVVLAIAILGGATAIVMRLVMPAAAYQQTVALVGQAVVVTLKGGLVVLAGLFLWLIYLTFFSAA